MKTKKRRGPSYIVMFLLTFAVVVLSGIVIWQCIKVHSLYKAGQADLTEIKYALSELEKYANTAKDDNKDTKDDQKENAFALQIELVYPPALSKDGKELGDTIAIVQSSNSQALSTINNYLIVFSILITIVVLVVPLFNYWFLQKEQIKRLDEQYASYSDQLNSELDRMRKSIQQSIRISYNVVSSTLKNQDGILIKPVEPISESSEDKAVACAFNSDVFTLKKQHNIALQKISMAIELDPDNAAYYLKRGITLHEMKRYEEALKDKNKAIELKPFDADCYESRAATLHELKRYEEALNDNNKAIELNPDSVRLYYSRAITLNDMERYEYALMDKNRIIELEPDNAVYYHSRAITLHELGQYKEALKDDCKAIELDPDNAHFYFERAATLHAMDQKGAALADINRAISLKPGVALYHYTISEVLLEMKRYTDALAEIDIAITIEPESAHINNIRCRLLMCLKHFQEALVNAEAATELEPSNSEYLSNLARCFLKNQIYKNALDCCKTLGENLELDYFALRTRALASLKQALGDVGSISEGLRVQALNDIEQALKIDPENRYSYIDQAQAFFLLQEYESMHESLKKSISLDRDEPETYHWFAEYFRAIGDNDNAALNDRIALEKGYIPEPEE